MENAAGGTPRYSIQGRTVEMPVVVRDATSCAVTYLVNAKAARRLLPGDEIELVELLPGRALLNLAVIEYRDNDLGDYNEVSIAFFVRARGASRGIPYLGTLLDFFRGRVATYIRHLPVDQSFTCEAGRTIWGFPKSVERIDFDATPEQVRCRLEMGGQHVLTLTAPLGGTRSLPEQEMTTYTYLEGVAHRTAFSSGAEGAGFGRGADHLELGDHPISEELRSLGLPKKALFTSSMAHMRGRFEAPVKL